MMVPMRDGTLLKTRVSLPEGEGPWPVLFSRTPVWDRDLCGSYVGDIWTRGYVVVTQNVRGQFGSQGEDITFIHDGWGHNQDGYDTILWILGQPWCNGKIGLYGGSSRGHLCNLMAGAGPPNVLAEWVFMATSDFCKAGVTYYGGALRHNEVLDWFSTLGADLLNLTLAHPTYDAWWEALDITTRQHVRNHPVVIMAGWFDTFQQGSLNNFISLRQHGGPVAREQSKLVIFLKGHGQNAGDVPWPISAVPQQYNYEPFFDRYLKNAPNHFDDLPRVRYFVMGDFLDPNAPGNTWRNADDWPVPALDTPIYLHNDGALRKTPPPPDAVSITYAFDPENPVPTLGGAVHLLPLGSFDQRPVEGRPDVLLFETEVLKVPVEVTGRMWVHLWASSDCVDTDFTAKLTDVYPDGKSIILCDGIIRARARNSLTEHEMMTPGTVYEFTIDLWSTAMIFNRGHRIRIAVSSSNFPRFSVNPNTGAPLALEYAEKRVARNTVYFDAAHPSHVILPITGPDTDGDGVFDWLDAFPYNGRNWSDADGDGLGDQFEQTIVNAVANDAFESIEEVLPESDFDGDGQNNRDEFMNNTDPTDSASRLPITTLTMLLAVVVAVSGAATLFMRPAMGVRGRRR